MKFREYGSHNLPTIILLHGGGLSWWSLDAVADRLAQQYRVVAVILDGHGEDSETTFVSIEHSAQTLLHYIDSQHGGQVLALCGLSLGGQIVAEILSQRKDVADFAVIESALVLPIPAVTWLTAPTFKLCYGLIKQRWFARLQAQSMALPESMFEHYYRDSVRMSRDSLVNMTISNGNYSLRDSIKASSAKVLVMVGEKERGIMIKSAKKLNEVIPGSKLLVVPGMRHGEISLAQPAEYVSIVEQWFRPLELQPM